MATTQRPPTEAAGPTLLNRELSWLDLNKRVLELAADPSEPLLERVKFCSIFSNNLDEFFMVRVAGLLDQVVARVPVRSPDGRTAGTLLEITNACGLSSRSRLWRNELCPRSQPGIIVGIVDARNGGWLHEARATFVQQIYPVLTPLAVGPGRLSGISGCPSVSA